MAQAQPRVDGDGTKAGTLAWVFDAAEPVAPSGADVLTLVHGGGGGVVDQKHGTEAKIGEALETAANGAVGDNPVERVDSGHVVTGRAIPGGGVAGQAIPSGVAEQAEDANATASRVELDDDIMKMKIFDPVFVMEYFSREDVLRDLAAFHEALGKIDISDCDEDQWRL